MDMDATFYATDPLLHTSALEPLALPPAQPQLDDDPLTSIRMALQGERTSGPPTLERIAHKLGMTERTFQRRLNQCGVTFRQLLAEQQRERATRLLAQRKLAISEVAFALGYSEQAAFARAFRRWTGQSPRSYRRNSLT
jgi:AraC-like DNA-binding protein